MKNLYDYKKIPNRKYTVQLWVILSEFWHVFQHFNSIGRFNIVYDTGTSLAVQVLAFDNVNVKTWSKYLERLDEEFIERSGT